MFELSEAEKADRINGFVWDMSGDLRTLVYSGEAMEFYEHAEQGIRVRHVEFLGRLIKFQFLSIAKDPNCGSVPLEPLNEQLTWIRNYLNVTIGIEPVFEIAEVTSILSRIQKAETDSKKNKAIEQAG